MNTEILEALLMVVDQSMTTRILKQPVLDPGLICLPNEKCALELLEKLGYVQKWDVIPNYYVFTDKALSLCNGYL